MTTLKTFKFSLAYSVVTVCDEIFAEEAYDWSPEEVRQGFLWEPGNTVFRARWDAVRCFIEVCLKQEFHLKADAIRAISVPFPVSDSNKVLIMSAIGREEEIQLEQGNYTLIFENGIVENYVFEDKDSGKAPSREKPLWCRLTFIPKESVEAEILRADDLLDPIYPLCMGHYDDE